MILQKLIMKYWKIKNTKFNFKRYIKITNILVVNFNSPKETNLILKLLGIKLKGIVFNL